MARLNGVAGFVAVEIPECRKFWVEYSAARDYDRSRPRFSCPPSPPSSGGLFHALAHTGASPTPFPGRVRCSTMAGGLAFSRRLASDLNFLSSAISRRFETISSSISLRLGRFLMSMTGVLMQAIETNFRGYTTGSRRGSDGNFTARELAGSLSLAPLLALRRAPCRALLAPFRARRRRINPPIAVRTRLDMSGNRHRGAL